MPYVQVPKDLTKVKTKVAFNLTKRQLVCFSIAAATAVPTYFLAKGAIGNTAAMLLLIVVAMPSFLAAMYEKNGQPLEMILRHFIEARIVRPKDRPYKTDNYYAALIRVAEVEKKVTEIMEGGDKA